MGTLLSAPYNSLAHPTGKHVVQACFAAPTDVYARTFCAAPSTFLNVGES